MSSEGAKMPHSDQRKSSSGNSNERKRPLEEKRKRKITHDVRMLANARRDALNASMSEERQDTERRKRRIQDRINQIETDIDEEERRERPIPERLKRFRATLQRERENMRRHLNREMEEEEERTERTEEEREELDIWRKEEEQRRLSEEEQSNEPSSDHKMKLLWIVFVFFPGLMIGVALTLLVFKFFPPETKSEHFCLY